MTQMKPREIGRVPNAPGFYADLSMTLTESLAYKTVTELRQLAAAYDVKYASKLRKEDLIRAVRTALLERKRLEEVLYIVKPEEWKLFQKAARAPYRSKNTNQEPYKVLQGLGYLQVFQDGGRLIYVVPEEVGQLYQGLLSDGFQAHKERSDLVHAYASAAVNLYGVIRQDDLIALFNSQNGKKLMEEDLFSILIRHIALERGYVLWEEYLVSDAFEENDCQDVPDLLAQTGDKPRYIPGKAEFLKYADPDYYEPTPFAALMERYLLEDAGLGREIVAELMSELHYAIILESGVKDLLGLLHEYRVPIEPDDLQIIADLLSGMKNNTRIWSNNGHTPNEIFEWNERKQLKNLPPIKPAKLGRNDPCPCGSGKKYKRCCGR